MIPKIIVVNIKFLQDETDEEDVDDLIELRGLGMIRLWRFPRNINRCPVSRCNAAFKSRSDILAHYRTLHAPNYILCPVCSVPVSAPYPSYVIKHFQNAHKDMEIPAEFNVMIANDNQNNEDDDLIELKGAGQVTYFRFPQNTTCCPARNCSLNSGYRSRAIAHYKRKHANDYIWCEQCARPVGAKCLDTFLQHYNTIHPDIELPEYLKKQKEDEVSSIP